MKENVADAGLGIGSRSPKESTDATEMRTDPEILLFKLHQLHQSYVLAITPPDNGSVGFLKRDVFLRDASPRFRSRDSDLCRRDASEMNLLTSDVPYYSSYGERRFDSELDHDRCYGCIWEARYDGQMFRGSN